MTATEPTTTTDPTWDTEFQKLQARFPGTKDSILFCIHALQLNDTAELGELKAQANLHGIRITAASLSAARRQLAEKKDNDSPAAPRRSKPNPLTAAAGDTEALIRHVVSRVQGQQNAEADKLRAVIRKAISTLETALAT